MTELYALNQTQKLPLNGTVSERATSAKLKFYRKKTCLITRNHVLIIAILFVLILIVTIIATYFATKSSICYSLNKDSFKPSYRNIHNCLSSQIVVNNSQNTSKHQLKLFSQIESKLIKMISSTHSYRLPSAIIPLRYNLTLIIDLSTFIFNGSVDIDIFIRQRTSLIIVNVNNLNIDSSRIFIEDKRTKHFIGIKESAELPELNFYVVDLRENLIVGRTYVLRFGFFSGPIQRDLRGLYLSSYKSISTGETRYLATSQLQSTDARKVFPCFDEPQLKAEFSVTIVHQKEYRALSNNWGIQSDVLPNGWIKTKFDRTPLMSSYLLAFVVSDMTYKSTNISNLMIRMWCRPSSINQTEFALSYAAKTYEFFTHYFGIPEVMNKTDHVAVPDFGGGAMENWGLVIYRETSLLYDKEVSSSYNKYMIALIVAHEIVHTWFGNMVTMKWWTDLWLNEGFASTLMFFAMDHAYPDWKVYDIQVVVDIFPVMIDDGLTTSHPVSTPEIKHPTEILQYFDVISYNKGMAILRMLRGFLGWTDFRRGLQRYILKYKFKNAEMADLWQVFSETVGHRYNVSEIMDTWTVQMGYPVVSVARNGRNYILTQERLLLDPTSNINVSESSHRYIWHIPFTWKTQSDMNIVNLHWISSKMSSIPMVSHDWILGNVEMHGYYLVNYEPELWNRLIRQLKDNHSVFSPSDRAGLLHSALHLARAGLLDYSIALNLTTYLQSELDFVPWKAFSDTFYFLQGMLSTKYIIRPLEDYFRQLVTPVFEHINITTSDSPLLVKYMQRLLLDVACALNIDKAVDLALKMFYDWMYFGKRIPVDFTQSVYRVGIQRGGIKEWDYLWNQSCHMNVATEKQLMREALAHTHEPALLWRYLNWMFDESKIRLQDVKHLTSAMSNAPLSRVLFRFFVISKWKEFLKIYRNNWFGMKETIPHFTKYMNTELEYNQVKSLFAKDPPETASESANNALAQIRANIFWMNNSYLTIKHWLNEKVSRKSRPHNH